VPSITSTLCLYKNYIDILQNWKGASLVKVEVDEVYCCDYVMESREVLDVETKRRTLVFTCKHCRDSFQIDSEIIKEQPQ
jgi:hypothetical protein